MEERKHFIYGSKELNIPGCIKNGISEEIAETIYDQMIDFAKYAFNKSHAAAYAAITMQTAYLKANFPLEFMTGLLSSVIDNTKKLIPYMAECKKMGIEILPPDLNKSNVMFRTEKNSIRFGLLAIKGVGENDLKKLIKEREENGDYKNITDILNRTSDETVFGKGLFMPLIQAGALDFIGNSRRALLENVESIIKNYKKETKTQIKGQLSLFDMIGEDIKTDCIEEHGEYQKKEILKLEKEATGTYISGHPLEEYELLLKNNIKNSCYDLSEDNFDNINDNDNVKIAGLILSVKKIYTKKEQKPMAFITVEDMTGSVDVVVFPKVYEKAKDLLLEDNIIIVKGRISKDEEETKSSILAEEILTLDSIKRNIHIKFDTEEELKSSITTILDIIKKYPGKDNIYLHIRDNKEGMINQNCIDIEEGYKELSRIFKEKINMY